MTEGVWTTDGRSRVVRKSGASAEAASAAEPFDPAGYTARQVLAYLSFDSVNGVDRAEVERVRAAEAAGRNRSTLLHDLDRMLA
ncbi:MAG: hypothetical protein WBM08_09380 [Prochlorococcaceae cyanobacterium]